MRASCFHALLVTGLLSLALGGCSINTIGANRTTNTSVPVAGVALQGRVHGGQNPISGASVYLYAANITGYGNASVSLLDAPGYVTTDSTGSFTITGNYTCPSATAQVYLYALGGNPGSGVNSAAGMLAGLGSCGSLSSSTYIVINEVSTIATAYAIAGYATDATHVSSSGSALAVKGIANAFATINNLETLSTGVPLAATAAGNGTVPQSKTDTLANILAACINSTGSGSSACTTLLGAALSGGTTGTAPTDTATAAINIAHNPWANVATLYGLQTASSPFQPDLSVLPNDYAVAIIYPSNGCFNPTDSVQSGPAVDGSGNIWVVNAPGPGCSISSTITELSPTGVLNSNAPFSGGGLSTPSFIAVDGLGNVWVANTGYVSGSSTSPLSEFSPTGTPESGSGFTGGLEQADALAVDKSNNVWATGYVNNALAEFNQSGSSIFNTTLCESDPEDIAIDISGHIWVPDAYDLCEYSSSGALLSPASGYSVGNEIGFYGIAFDATGNLWAPFAGNSEVWEISSTGSNESGSPFLGGGVDFPHGVAIDGSGNVWVTNVDVDTVHGSNGQISEFTSSGVPITGSIGYQDGNRSEVNPAIDGSGNVWVQGPEYPSGTEALVEIVGAATPVATPIVANLQAPYGSYAVNKP